MDGQENAHVERKGYSVIIKSNNIAQKRRGKNF